MKKCTIIFALIATFFSSALLAQDPAQAAFMQGNNQYVLYESERDKGANADLMYDYLYDSYEHFVKVLGLPNNSQYVDRAKNRLRAMYPALFNAAVHYEEKMNPAKVLNFAGAYVDMPQMPAFRSEMLPQNDQYPSVVFLAATRANYLKQSQRAAKYFNSYLNLPDSDKEPGKEKSAYVSLSMLYNGMKDYTAQEQILLKAIAKYPVEINFYYNLVNVYMATNNHAKLLNTFDQILAINPNDEQILPLKANILKSQGNYTEALEIYKRLHALHPNDIKILRGLATANYSSGVTIIEEGRTVIDNQEYALIHQRAMPYFAEARNQLQQVLAQNPSDKQCMIGLANTYKFLDMTAESEVLTKMIEVGENFSSFDARLVAYNEALSQQQQAANAEAPEISVPVNPAQLAINISEFTDGNNNKVIDAGESFTVKFNIVNSGLGDAFNVRLRFTEQNGYDQYFDGPKELDGGNIPAGTTKEYTFRYVVKKEMPTALAMINIYAFEANGFDADPAEIKVNTQEYAMPRLKIADYQFFAEQGSSITIGNNGKITVALQNLGTQTARGVKLNFKLPDNVFATDNSLMQIDSIAPGDVKIIDYNFIVNKRFQGDSLAVMLTVNESTNSTSINDAYKVKMGEYLTSASALNLSGNLAQNRTVVAKDFSLSFKSELLEDIPEGNANPHRYALIMGNEDYSMVGANAEINVPYAINDAMVFKEYCVRAFGIPEHQIKVVPNATTGMMHEQIDWLLSMAKTDPQAEIFFYYSGHGSNDEASNEPFLLPVDITGKNVRLGISLTELYDDIAKHNIKAYVFLDACFSGGYKSAAPLIAQKGVRIAAKMGVPQGYTLSFASSSGDQTSSVYHDKKQGYYTYFLIKTLKDAKGDITMKELFEKTTSAVRQATALIGKIQEPQYMVPPTWPEWANLKLVTPMPAEVAVPDAVPAN